MPAKWTGEIVALLHVNEISQKELAQQLGLTRQYVSLVLSGTKDPSGMEARMRSAIGEIIMSRKAGER